MGYLWMPSLPASTQRISTGSSKSVCLFAVFPSHCRCLDACKPGSSIRELHQLSVHLISEALRELRLVPQGLSVDAIAAQHTNTFYWHSLGHMVGLDTHDVATMGFDRCVRGVGCGQGQSEENRSVCICLKVYTVDGSVRANRCVNRRIWSMRTQHLTWLAARY